MWSAKESRRVTSLNLLTKLRLLQPRSPLVSVARVLGGSAFIWCPHLDLLPSSFPAVGQQSVFLFLNFTGFLPAYFSGLLKPVWTVEQPLAVPTTDPSFQATSKSLFWLHVCWMETCNISLEPLACYGLLFLPRLSFLSLAVAPSFLLHFILESLLLSSFYFQSWQVSQATAKGLIRDLSSWIIWWFYGLFYTINFSYPQLFVVCS